MSSFRRHWFIGLLLLLLGVWAVFGLAYLSGADGVTVRARGGQSVTLDFMRDQENPVVLGLAESVGLELETDGSTGAPPGELSGVLIELEPVPLFMCACGAKWTPTSIAIVDYRQGDWFFRAPKDLGSRGSFESGSESWRTAKLTLAYNAITGERVLQDFEDTLERQQSLLTEHGFVPSDELRLDVERLTDLKLVSMQSERCMIYFGAFLASLLLWLLIGGPIALIQRRNRRAKT